jgi:hypothetical protein
MTILTLPQSLHEVSEAAERWTPAEISSSEMIHAAQSIEYSLSGFPMTKGHLFQVTAGWLAARIFLTLGRMKHDVAAPIPGAPAIPQDMPRAEAVRRLRQAIRDFYAHTGELQPHFAYGALAKPDYDRLQTYHVVDHLRVGR